MGVYIQGPLQGKGSFIQENLNGVVVKKPNSFKEIPADKFLICVINNGPFEAAAVCFDEREFIEFNNPSDYRPKEWLLVDKGIIAQVLGYNPER